MKEKVLYGVLTLATVVFVLWMVSFVMRPERDPAARPAPEPAAEATRGPKPAPVSGGAAYTSAVVSDEPSASAPESESDADPEPPKSPEERKASEEEARVEAFDNLTDSWMEPKDVTMRDVEAFVTSFRSVPKARRDECVHRALNLIPDENVLLLAGILTDKSFDRDTLEAVFNDVLNRDEEVKKPILELVYKDRTHPCWADVAWIFDVTGERPDSGK